MSQISNDWLEALKPEFAKPYYRDYISLWTVNTGRVWYIRRRRIYLAHLISRR